MGFADLYLSKQKGFRPFFQELPSSRLRYAVVIPAYREPHVIRSLESLHACMRPAFHAEIIIVVNRPENADEEVQSQTRQMIAEISEWIERHRDPAFQFLLMPEQVLPDRDAGVGLARKTGMDQAVSRFNALNFPSGMIICYDADSHCEPNYFTALESTLQLYPRTRGVNLYFEHPLEGDEPLRIYQAIAGYELHLRYMNLFCRYTGFPFAFHTIGSCFGVRAETYAREGGMNRRKAGEDFYFLHKVIPLGEFREINTTCVSPSPRISDRVPFGTGAAMTRAMEPGNPEMLTYHPDCYLGLKTLFDQVPDLYRQPLNYSAMMQELPESVSSYLEEIGGEEAIREIRDNAASPGAFISRFYRWFNAFRIIKYLNYATRKYYGQIEVREAAETYLHISRNAEKPPERVEEMLRLFRKLERER